MKHIVYLSKAVRPLSDQDLQFLLQQCRHNNSVHNITGILFYSHGSIAQLFEGEEKEVDTLFDKIAQDDRHSHVVKLVDKPIATRSFAQWSMAFHPLEPAGFSTLEGFLMPDQLPPTPTALSIADTMLVELVRLAVFNTGGTTPSFPVFLTGATPQ